MVINSAAFVKSSRSCRECPDDRFPEFAFVGRSNVGKSSLINLICGRKSLAKTSVTPGKTRLINHFLVNESWYLADLPGIGYARVSKKEQKGWAFMLSDYFLHRRNLVHTFILADCRHAPLPSDLKLISVMKESALPYSLVLTKTDKITAAELHRNIGIYKNTLEQQHTNPRCIFTVSAQKKKGGEEILAWIEQLNQGGLC